MHQLTGVFLAILVLPTIHQYQQSSTTTGPPKPYFPRTRSLNGAPATDGYNVTNQEYYNLLTLTILKGINIFRIKQFNDRHYLERTRRSYWFGDRYFRLDNYYWLSTRDTCAYRMNETERKNIMYDEDNTPIFDIFYQCLRYEEYCCGLDCCRMEDLNKPQQHQPRHMRTPWDKSSHISVPFTIMLSFLSILLL